MSLRWAERDFRAEIELSNELLDDIDRVAKQFARSDIDEFGMPRPRHPGSWRGLSGKPIGGTLDEVTFKGR